MKTVSDGRIFVDTNILFYANDPSFLFGEKAIARINELAALNNEMIISALARLLMELCRIKIDLSSQWRRSLGRFGGISNEAELFQNYQFLLNYDTAALRKTKHIKTRRQVAQIYLLCGDTRL